MTEGITLTEAIREIKQVYLKHQDVLKYVFLLPL
mgnify:CR=1 FL=1|jgi:hypothetical protein|nr:MAG TPA: hypothetical protein [Caudoviricetes sp.]